MAWKMLEFLPLFLRSKLIPDELEWATPVKRGGKTPTTPSDVTNAR